MGIGLRDAPMSSRAGCSPTTMDFTAVYAQSPVTDLEAAERWYSLVFDRPPDARPMDGLLTWVLGDGRGVQVWRDAERAGRSALTLNAADLDAVAAHLTAAEVQHGGAEPGGGARLIGLSDPDGNQVVITGA